jgi:large subunit ribosomal protein L9
MKIILLQDVAGTGKKWEVKEVKGGYFRNFLLPNNLAVLATPKTLKDIEIKKEQETQKRVLQEKLLEKSLETFRDSVLTIERKANEKGLLFDKLDTKEIRDLLGEKTKVEIPAECIKLEEPLKETGRHKITVQYKDREIPLEIEIKAMED